MVSRGSMSFLSKNVATKGLDGRRRGWEGKEGYTFSYIKDLVGRVRLAAGGSEETLLSHYIYLVRVSCL